MRRLLLPALLVLAVLVAPGCGSKKASGPRPLIINNNAEPQTLDPGLQKGVPEHNINICLFEGLASYDPKDLTPRPGVAERWDISDDLATYTFHLRAGARWSNGDPVTAADFEWSWKRVCEPKLASEYAEAITNYLKNAKSYYEGTSADLALASWESTKEEDLIKVAAKLPKQVQQRHAERLKALVAGEKREALRDSLSAAIAAAPTRPDVSLDMIGVKAKDDRTLVVTLEAATPYFPDLAAFFTYYPVHRATVEKHGDRWTRVENHVGNGPYRLKEWKAKEYILLEKNPAYWDAANVTDQAVKFLPVENQSTAFNMYEKGDVDWLTNVPGDFIEELKKRPDFHSAPMLTTYFYGFNCTRGPTKDPKVRRALALAVDRDKIVQFITRAGERPALSIAPPGMPGYAPATMPAFDPVAARAALAEAGYPGGKGFPKLEVLYNTDDRHKKIAAAIQEMWRNHLGIDVELRNVEWKTYLDMQSRLQFDVIRRGWVADYTDPNTFLDMWTTDNGNNNQGYSNPAYDKLVFGAMKEKDPAKRMAMLHDAERILMDDQPVIPFYFYVSKNMWKAEVQGLYDNVRDTHPLHRVKHRGNAP